MTDNPLSGILVTLALVLTTTSAPAAPQDSHYTIMRPEPGAPQKLPEPWLPPKYQSPRGSREHVANPHPAPAPPLIGPCTPTTTKLTA